MLEREDSQVVVGAAQIQGSEVCDSGAEANQTKEEGNKGSAEKAGRKKNSVAKKANDMEKVSVPRVNSMSQRTGEYYKFRL